MIRNERKVSVSGMVISFLIVLNSIFLKEAYVENEQYYGALVITVPLMLFAIWEHFKK